jgi:hypothetical protein
MCWQHAGDIVALPGAQAQQADRSWRRRIQRGGQVCLHECEPDPERGLRIVILLVPEHPVPHR